MGVEKSVLRWGGLAGILAGIIFIFTIVILIAFVPLDPVDTEGLVMREPDVRAVFAALSGLHLVDLLLSVTLFLVLVKESLAEGGGVGPQRAKVGLAPDEIPVGYRDVIVVGGGLAGLSVATFLARAGKSVILFERSASVGGRARTQDKNGFLFNQGPHALYWAGASRGVLRELGIPFTGGVPYYGGYGIHQGRKYALPDRVLSLFRTRLLRLPAKIEGVRLFRFMRTLDSAKLQHLSVQKWLEGAARHRELRELLGALFRLFTYVDDPTQQSVSVALRQFQMASFEGGVRYLDGGWQVLVDGLLKAASESGVKVVTGAKVTAVEHDGTLHRIRLEKGRAYGASSVVMATSPARASELIEGGRETALGEWAETAVPVKMACLDIALKQLPDPRAVFALGVDRPTYLSVHSTVGRLAPEGGALIHVAKYLGSSSPMAPKSDERELEELLDIMQPGWRDVLVYRRFLPNMVASNALVTAKQGGTAGRPGPEVPGIPNLYVAGDWVGSEGWLSDASLASAKRVAELILRGEGRP